MTECIERLISEYIDGELSPAAACELEDHFRTCGECRAILSEYRSIVAATRFLAAGGRTRDHGRRAAQSLHHGGFGHARTSDLLA